MNRHRRGLLSRCQGWRNIFLASLGRFLWVSALALSCCIEVEAEDSPASGSGDMNGPPKQKTQLELVELAANYSRSDWDRLADLWASKHQTQVPSGKRAKVLEQVQPWLKLTLAESFLPTNLEKTTIFVVRDPQKGDVYLISYTALDYQMRILDTPASLMVTIKDPRIQKGRVEGLIENWRKWVRSFMNNSRRFDSPPRLGCWKTSTSFYLSPMGADSDKLGRQECWWVKVSYKISDGEFTFGALKSFDGEHADPGSSKKQRYE